MNPTRPLTLKSSKLWTALFPLISRFHSIHCLAVPPKKLLVVPSDVLFALLKLSDATISLSGPKNIPLLHGPEVYNGMVLDTIGPPLINSGIEADISVGPAAPSSYVI